MSKQIIPVVFATDTNYVPYCGVAISSLVENASPENDYEVYVLYDKLTHSDIVRLERLSNEYVHVQALCIHENIAKLKVTEHHHLTIASAYRLVIPEVLPQYDKILYLDSDIVVNDDVAEMYQFDLGENILGAVPGYYSEGDWFSCWYMRETLKIKEENFFNAGILSINCKEFLKQKIKEKAFALLSERTDLLYMDQCALNIICEGKVKMLPARWNYEWLFLCFDDTKNDPIMENPAIIHFDGIEKPWNCPGMLLADYFWKYARNTYFYEEILRLAQIRTIQDIYDTFGTVGNFRNIAIYGAGNAGKRYVDKLLRLKICSISVWVDKNYQAKTDAVLPVVAPEELYRAKFDRVIIAIENKDVSREVAEMLMSNGVEEEKIMFIN